MFQLISDLGGFQAAIMILPTFLMGHYSSRMYKSAIAQEIPVRNLTKSRNKAKKYSGGMEPTYDQAGNESLYRKLKNGSQLHEGLSQTDVRSLFEAASSTTFASVSYVKSLFHVGCICRKDREA